MNTPVVVRAMSIILSERAGSLQWRQLWAIQQKTIKIAANLSIILYRVRIGGGAVLNCWLLWYFTEKVFQAMISRWQPSSEMQNHPTLPGHHSIWPYYVCPITELLSTHQQGRSIRFQTYHRSAKPLKQYLHFKLLRDLRLQKCGGHLHPQQQRYEKPIVNWKPRRPKRIPMLQAASHPPSQ